MSAFRSFVAKEVRHILRDRQTLVILLLMPVVQVLLFGFAIRTDVQNVRLAVVDPSGDARSAALVRDLAATPSLQPVVYRSTSAGVEALLRAGRVDAAVVLPDDFARRFQRGDAQVLLLTDATNANYARAVEAYLSTVIERWAAGEGMRGAPAEAGQGVVVRAATRMRFNPTLASANLFVPGLLAFVLMIVSALMTAISLAKEKETGTLEVLLVSPLRPLQIVVGKVAPYLVLAFVNAVTTIGIAYAVFGVPVRGSLLLLLAASLVYVLVALALGVVISSRAPDQRTAILSTLLGLLLPTIALSGFIFPIASMPGWLHPVTQVFPATWFIVIARGIMLKGVGLDVLWKEALVLAGMAVVLLVLGARAFRDRLD